MNSRLIISTSILEELCAEQHQWTLEFNFHFLAILARSNKICYATLHTIPQINIFQVMDNLCGTQIDEISRTMRFCHDPLLELILL